MADGQDYASQTKQDDTNSSDRLFTPSTTVPPPTPQLDTSSWNSPSLESNLEIFGLSSAEPGPSAPSFASASSTANNSISNMAFPQVSSQYNNWKPFQTTLDSMPSDSHNTKRIKVESPPSALDSMDSWLQFDDDVDKFGSFEIDYSKQLGLANQPRQPTDMTPGLGSGLYANPTAPFREEDFIDDSAFDHSLSDDDDLFDSMNLDESLSNINTLPTNDLSSQRNFYSTPLNWDKPQPGGLASTSNASNERPRRMGVDAWDALPQGSNYSLNPEERRRLLEIAMGPSRLSSFVYPGKFNMGYGSTVQSSPSPLEYSRGMAPRQAMNHVETSQQRGSSTSSAPASGIPQTNTRDLKHKSPKNEPSPKPTSPKRSGTQSELSLREKPKSADRMAHNDVERKYRTNLKDKITELRNAVPSLQQTVDGDDQDAAQGATKVSKGTVLTKATEYIHQLEQHNKDIMTEHAELMRRLQAFEALVNGSMHRADMMPSHSMTLFDPRGFC